MPNDPETAPERMVPASLDPCLEKREQDEPMFILLARDSAAPAAIEAWCRARAIEIERGQRPGTEAEWSHINQVSEKAIVFRTWRKANR